MRLEQNARPGAGTSSPVIPATDPEALIRWMLDLADLASVSSADEYPAHLHAGALIAASPAAVRSGPAGASADDPFDSIT